METVTQSLIAMLAVINPFICGSMSLQLEKGGSKRTNIISAVKAMLVVLLILVIAALAGKFILNTFGISLDAFKVVGGIIISYIGFQMMGTGHGPEAKSTDPSGLSSLIMFAASPGTIAMVITLSAVHNKKDGLPVPALLGIVLAVMITIAVIILMQLLSGKGKKTHKHGIASRFMGLIVVAMGLQFLLDGLKHFFGS